VNSLTKLTRKNNEPSSLKATVGEITSISSTYLSKRINQHKNPKKS